jgi:2-C-methyl-D-erythritol 4-phosphate cytidylyltransferase / 2-C-methyl-D-erythritol 2,4-cyclodiphosphate synthase
MNVAKKTVALIVAAGTGSRVGGDIPKQFRIIGEKPLLRHSYETFCNNASIDSVFVVIAPDQSDLAQSALAGIAVPIFVEGGPSRQESVRNGLRAIAANGGADYVLIHDAARPFLSTFTIDHLIAALETNIGAVPVLPMVDSLARGINSMTQTVDRTDLWRIQTPQAFHFTPILKAHLDWDNNVEATDDARMLLATGNVIAFVPGDEHLAKYTFASDFEEVGPIMTSVTQIRSGTGYDVHRLIEGEELWLCGVKIEHPFGLSGHSDADVALHAITDALLGALAMGDIGDHFPPSDPQWRGASSDQFLRHAMQLATEKGFALSNIDLTIICEAPKIGPHRQAMRASIAEILITEMDRISVKATTTEGLGFTGRHEGIAAQAIATLVKLA